MGSPAHSRFTYEESCKLLQSRGLLGKGAIPPIPSHRPCFGDEQPLGVSFFKTFVEGGDLHNLSLPRSFFGRSQVGPASFKNSDLSESTMCWNDFIDVDFTDCDLSSSDLRASLFERVKLVRANLRNTDLRRSSFEECDFTDADMLGVRLVRAQTTGIRFSAKQQEEIDWQAEDGDEPEGG
jgi:uncharacterized protein YjbI with pentapeptide repeats